MTLKNGISNVSDDRDIKQKAYVYDVGSGDQSTSLGDEIESPNMDLTPSYSGVTTGPAHPASRGGSTLGGRQNRSKIWDIFC